VARAFGLPVPVYNSRARLAVLPYHDLHHVVTGYDTSEEGEAAVGAWTLGTRRPGARGPVVGWVYDLGTLGLGLLRAPRATLRAFYRGRRSHNLYARPLSDCLSASLGELEEWTRASDRGLGWCDHLALVSTLLWAALWWATPMAPLAMLGLMVVDAVRRNPRDGG